MLESKLRQNVLFARPMQIHQTQLGTMKYTMVDTLHFQEQANDGLQQDVLGTIYSWYLELRSQASHISKANDTPRSMADRDSAADVCLTNKQWPQETLISRRLLIDLLLINSKTVWFMGARTIGDSHLAWNGVLWMWGAHPGGPEVADSEGIKKFGNAPLNRHLAL